MLFVNINKLFFAAFLAVAVVVGFVVVVILLSRDVTLLLSIAQIAGGRDKKFRSNSCDFYTKLNLFYPVRNGETF